ncbi:MAG: hypothetical protein HUU16_10695 [Candidatus Omnitrophica bacterium]|nr:hypothetical protein [bacterium]NUN96629.1 hypothetical protein [Candidatus Omnitrophota bacterium]
MSERIARFLSKRPTLAVAVVTLLAVLVTLVLLAVRHEPAVLYEAF